MNDDGSIPIQKALKTSNNTHARYHSNSKHIKGSDQGGSPTWIHTYIETPRPHETSFALKFRRRNIGEVLC